MCMIGLIIMVIVMFLGTLKRESVKQPEVRLISIFSPVVLNIPAAEYILNNLIRNVLEFNTSHS